MFGELIFIPKDSLAGDSGVRNTVMKKIFLLKGLFNRLLLKGFFVFCKSNKTFFILFIDND